MQVAMCYVDVLRLLAGFVIAGVCSFSPFQLQHEKRVTCYMGYLALSQPAQTPDTDCLLQDCFLDDGAMMFKRLWELMGMLMGMQLTALSAHVSG